MPAPSDPKIYHITHVDNLRAIIATGGLLSDAEMLKTGGPNQMVGMSHIKERRLAKIRLEECYPDDFVGEYVPFYFCPRSVMLYLIYQRNSQLTYKGGQGPIVHLEADLHKVLDWAEEHGHKWAFSLSNAGAYGVEFRNGLDKMGDINWEALAANSWGNSNIKHWKQAEFLLYRYFPWNQVDRIGVLDNAVAQQVAQALVGADHHPQIAITRNWYY